MLEEEAFAEESQGHTDGNVLKVDRSHDREMCHYYLVHNLKILMLK